MIMAFSTFQSIVVVMRVVVMRVVVKRGTSRCER